MQSQMERPYGHDQTEDPIIIHHPEEEEHQEKGASKVLKKVKEKAKKIKNSLTKHGHGHEHDHDVDEEDDEYDEQDPEVHGAPVYESSAVRGGVTGQPESLSHPGETNVPAPEEIVPPGTKVFPVVSSDNTRPVEPEPLREASYGHEAPSHLVGMKDMLDREERRGAPSLPMADISERGERREAHHMPMNTTPASLLSTTEDVTSTFAPGEDEYLGGQRKVNVERPKGLEEDPAGPGGGSDYLSGVSNYQSKVTDPTKQGGGETGVPGIVESLGKMKVSDESTRRKSGREFDRDYASGLTDESGTGKDSPARFGGESGAGLGKDFPTRSHEFDQKTESGVNNDSPMVLESASMAGLGKDFPARSHAFEQKTESGVNKNSPTGLTGESGAGIGEESPARSHEYGIGRDSPRESHGYGKESESGLEKNIPSESEDVKVTTGLKRDLPTGTHHQFSPELSRPKERDDSDSTLETHEGKPSTYTDKIASATSVITDKAIAAKNAVASKLGYSSETTGAGGGVQHETTPRSATGYGQKVAGTVAGTLAPVYEKVKETGSNVMTKLPLSGGGRGAETQQGEDKGVSTRDYFTEKLRPGEEDKALSEVIAEKLHLGGGEKKTTTTKEVEVTVEKIPSDQILKEKEHGEVIAKEGKGGGGGMVGKVKGAVTSWLGGKEEEELKPKSSGSGGGKESSQSLGSTVGTTGFADSGGAVSTTQRGLQESGN
ncbi:hypothetical protein AALP_AA8G301300 [Arabis alpina]|uniref:Low-temperature-induced 65 kDa protein n=1 Tax=Arabis alpina TaxID=50452 RepID=A0A087GAE7_ARAAL|nr:hypothetical protein AALP_AA8G301300 [Arabis alpina]